MSYISLRMVYMIEIFLFILISKSISEEIRSLEMIEMLDMKFECINSNYSSSIKMSLSTLIDCQFACLANGNCLRTTYDQLNNQCELFDNISSIYGNLLSHTGFITMIVIDDKQSSVVSQFSESSTSRSDHITSIEPLFTSSISSIKWKYSTSILLSESSTNKYSSIATTSISCINTEVFPSGRSPTTGWHFEDNLNDYYNIYNGYGRNNLTYRIGRNGCGKCLNLVYNLQQSVKMNATPLIDFRSQSFSVETWIKPSIVADGNEHVIFGQCSLLELRQCMRTSISGNGALVLALRSDNGVGNRVIPINQWSHVSTVYNVTSRTIFIYLNGTLDASSSGHGLFVGVPYPLEIGDVSLYDPYVNISFGGCIDEVWVYPFARTSGEISATFALG